MIYDIEDTQSRTISVARNSLFADLVIP
jgi:hypothetical protein